MSVIWLTGLSGSGKTTLSYYVSNKIDRIHKTIVLDGDELRKGLNSDLGFSLEDRHENIRRVANLAKLFKDKGFIVFAPLISQTKESRQLAREIVGEGFHECYVKSDLETCIKRDVKGLYKKALGGEIKQFTGVTSVYDVPENPEIIIDTQNFKAEESGDFLISYLVEKDILKSEINNSWLKINYGGEKLGLTNKQRAVFIGRWQPFHRGHQELVSNKLGLGIPVLIMVRDVPNDSKNPFSTEQVVDMIKHYYEEQKDLVEVMVIPDIESVNFGRGVGYEVNEFIPSSGIENISATKIRKSIHENTNLWQELVSGKIMDKVKKIIG